MIEVISFKPIHLEQLDLQAQQLDGDTFVASPEYCDAVLEGEAFTLLSNGVVIMCCGVVPFTKNIGKAWALVSKDAGRDFILATRLIYNFLKKSSYARIETPVRRDFINGHRWCKLLRFVNETPNNGMKHYGFNGETYDLYAFYTKE